jgi:hypothetical protein
MTIPVPKCGARGQLPDTPLYRVEQGMLHINPALLQRAKQEFRCVGETDAGGEVIDRRKNCLVEDRIIMHVLGVILVTQYSVQKGIKLFGDRGKKSVKSELQQLHDMVTFIPVHAHELTREQRKQALASLMFMTEKRCGRIKTRACANGSKQRQWIRKEDAASPTVMGDSVMITSAIEAHEKRKVITLDIPGAFLNADLDEEVIMLLRGELAELMVTIDPVLYGPYMITTARGEKLLYVKMLKAMYGLMRAALLFYLKLRSDLEEYGFVMNEYDPCVGNKMVGGKQMTVTWHVDDLKASHVDELELTKLVMFLGKKYGEKITVHRGDMHDYLGMDMDYSEKGIVKLSMLKHLEKIFSDFPEDIGRASSSPASEHLFQVRDAEETERTRKYLSPKKAEQFHHSVAQLLFVCGKVRRDIQTAVSFLTTRVKRPDEDDWGKLKRVLKYLKGTRHMKLTLSVDDVSIIRWWVDASYNVHEDCRGQTGAMMSLGGGAPISLSRKQKLNVRSSCEGELVGIDDALPSILWTRYFIESQGYTVDQNIVYQDNKSTILLANNGRWSSSKRTKHIKSRFFFIKDCVDRKEISVEHQPSERMYSDILTKPKQGKAFRRDRAMLMNCSEDYNDAEERARTHPSLADKIEEMETVLANKSALVDIPVNSPQCRRSVLEECKNGQVGGPTKRYEVAWSQNDNRVSDLNEKARKRHLEAVKARIIRNRQKANMLRGRE